MRGFLERILAAPGDGPLFAVITGTEDPDQLNGTDDADEIYGLGGNDTINGAGGDDLIDGGAGSDTLDGGEGIDTVSFSSSTVNVSVRMAEGTATMEGSSDTFTGFENVIGTDFGDVILGDNQNNRLEGRGDNDSISGEGGDDVIYGGDGWDRLFGEIDPIVSGIGVLGGDDVIYGGAGGDHIEGGDGDDQLYGEADNDSLEGGAGNDTIDGGDGDDVATYRFDDLVLSDGVVLDLSTTGAGTVSISDGMGGIDTLTSIERFYVVGTEFGDALYGGAGRDDLTAGAGNDILVGGGGGDALLGGHGADYLVGGAGADVFIFESVDDSPNDGSGFDAIADFGSGDAIRLSFVTERIFLSRLGDSTYIYFNPQEDGSFAGVIQAVGDVNGNHVQYGGSGVTLYGEAGADDILYGGSGADILVGQSGDDQFRGGRGVDVMYGGEGRDVFDLGFVGDNSLDAWDTIGDFTSNQDQISLHWLQVQGQAITLSQFGGSTFIYYGATGATSYSGLVIANGVVQGSDLVLWDSASTGISYYGSASDDTLVGTALKDTIIGGNGADIIIGGGGGDSLYGGGGADVFRITDLSQSTSAAWDVINDFEVGTDKLDLSAVATEVLISTFGGSTFVYFNPNGTGGYNGLVIVSGVTLTHQDVLVGGSNSPVLIGKEGAQTVPPLIDLLDPLVLPAAGDAKVSTQGDAPVICVAQDDVATGLGDPGFDVSHGLYRDRFVRDWSGNGGMADDWVL